MQRDDLSLLIEIAQQQRKTATTMLLVAVQSRSTAAEMVDEASVMWNRAWAARSAMHQQLAEAAS